MRGAREPWWIIGSAAVALHGADAGHVHDVDLLVGHDDARRLFARLNIAPLTMAPDPLFRSALFARWSAPPVPVEIMAGFAVASGETWSPVWPQSRRAVRIGEAVLYVPERGELIALLRRFGRPKDQLRAAALEGRAPG
ncbi:hypothetical protein M9979_06705 [Sphingomonas sp. RP10(2022)]|uniref:Nucleotidyltransferase family protein n=2 Tax=Sphingomonas liriopis TaxID=2949094 RepID=A0A9X2KT64_9SPHN|nr:hypothetical protein [Sphingomonas liriopis]